MTFVSILTPSEAITNYSDLLDYVRKVLDRGTDFDECFDEWIRLVESRLNRILRVPDMEAFYTAAVTTETLPLPEDFLSLRSAWLSGTPNKKLPIMSMAGLIEEFGRQSGDPRAVALEAKTLRFAPIGDTEVSLTYYKKIPPLSLDLPVNWLLERHPDVYVYGMCLQAETVIDDPRLVQQWKAAYDETIAEIKGDGNRNRWSGPMVSSGWGSPVRGVRC